ncbi:glycosyltransferase [Streptomyces sp. NBC_01497]|uniref:glycosyltransferase n=1 Tax=Streptomyces sp. NBC_01497 TaxID=2903885 RepID=UPI002E367D1F|nr:nucleotide disphospho-sugar-binding domain-containing protein [Streptomyces sp. NBC_01497]
MLPEAYDTVPDNPSGQVQRFCIGPRPRLAPHLPRGEGKALVFVTFGTEAHKLPFTESILRQVVEGAASMPIRLLVAAGGADTSRWGPLADNVRVEPWVDQDKAIAAAAAVVCHAGAGTVFSALRAGVPLVAIPLFADQPDNAKRVHDTRVGLSVVLGPDRFVTPVHIRESLDRVLHLADYRIAASQTARDIEGLPSVKEAVVLLEAAAGC